MSSRVDYSALLMYRATEESGASGIQERYFVPQAAVDAFDVRQRSAPLAWSARAGSAEMRLQRYVLPLVITGEGSPSSITTFPGTPQNVTITFSITNNLDDESVSLQYLIPSNLTPFAVIGAGTPTISCFGASGEVVIAPGATEEVFFEASYTTNIGETGSITGMVFPGSIFTYAGNPWEADISFSVTWNSEEF